MLFPAVVGAFELKIVTNNLEDDIRETSLLTPLSEQGLSVTPQDVLAAAQADYGRLVGLMYDRGFFAPEVSILLDGREAALLSLAGAMRQIKSVELRVATGPSFKFGQARIAPLPADAERRNTFATGETASTNAIKTAVDNGIDDWRTRGYPKATVASQSIIARHDANRLDVDIRLNPGRKLRFGNLVVDGNARMRPERVVEIAGLPTGQIFDPAEVTQASVRLRRSGVFSSIALTEADAVSPTDTLNIDAQIIEAKLRRFGFGAELSTHDGLGLSGFWLHRNVFGGGERLRIGGEIKGIGGETGGNDYELSLAFSRPATFNTDTDFYANASVSSFEEPNFSSDRVTLEAGIRRYASLRREYTLGVGYIGANTTDVFGDQTYHILTLPVSAEFDYRDNDLNATKGYYLKASLTPFLNLRGTSNGLRGTLDARSYRSFGKDERFTFAVRGQFGFVAGPSIDAAPADFLFYSGGGGTVRGQDYQSLGVDLGGGNVIGGASFMGVSSELRVKTGEKTSFVGFYDAGLIGSDVLPGAGSSDWHIGAGFGVRYDTGIGPIRLDVGTPVGGQSASGVKVYIGIGQSF